MDVFTNHYRVAVVVSVVVSFCGVAHGMVVDGQLDDWGVTPFVHWTPSTGTAYIVDNWGDKADQTGAYPYGGEVFDLEAGYARSDNANLYLAIVTSMPEDGVNDPYGRPNHLMPGDIAISLNGQSGYTWGIQGYGSGIGTVVQNPTWSLPDGSIGIPSNGVSTMSGGTQTGQGSAVYVDAGVLEPDGSHTYVIEMAIPWSVFPTNEAIDTMAFHYAPTCANDVLNWGMTVPSTPDPSVIALLSMGLAVMPMRMRMRSSRITAD